MSDTAFEFVTLKNGVQVPLVLANIVFMHLEDMRDKTNPDHPVHEGEPLKSMSYLLALYDLLKLSESEAYSDNCFGGNRQKLLDRHLVEGAPTGPLRVRPEIRAVVLSSLSYDPATTAIRVQSPY
jgi:hypothetical protein